MHGREGEERRGGRSCNWHMRTVPTRVGVAVAPDADGSSSSSASSSPNSFHKDGRKISVGDCALFKPPQDSPPFIGIIRSLTLSKENDVKLGVNWLYRPAEVKLSRGILPEAAPNEIFYSFHRDETLAASLLHPCKVAFLPKGVELPSGICSFVCRRVYDISNRCLWWLTDQDYINEHQEEVDQLLDKTRIEMHATVQPNGRSPKRMNGPTSASQLKSGSDCVQNSASSFASHSKGKKRERGDQGSEPIKRERSIKMDDGDSGHSRSESFLRYEIAKITEKGGLVDLEGVEKLLQLMLPDRSEKKVDLVGRSMLTGVIAGTDKDDCLNQFIQLKGLPVLDEWLQEVHKGKVGDGSSHKDNDKSVDEFILVLLRALDRLPVDLEALKMCNIGKSVNNLRSHKNSEIQKKARSLIDTWKKRVEFQMNIIDAKSGSNQEIVHGGNRNVGGSSEAATKSSVSLPAAKSPSIKLLQGEVASKSAVSPGSLKSAPSHASSGGNLKDGQARSAVVSTVSDHPLTISRDEKSSSSSQSHNNSQSCSSDRAKTGAPSGKEDARSSTAGSGRVSTGPSRHKKLVNCLPGSSASGREMGSSRTSLHRNVAPEKVSQSGLTSEKAVDVPFEVNSHKLIVKIPNRGRSPAQNASGGSCDDPSVMISRASSPVRLERPDQFDPGLKEKTDACQANISSDVNAESWENNHLKDMVTSCDEGDGSPGSAPQDDCLKTGENTKMAVETSKTAMSSPGSEFKLGRMPEASPSSMNALVESCVKVFKPSASDSVEDDIGMNLLASVAAGEMLMSEMVSPVDSPQQNPSAVGQSCTGNDSKTNLSPWNHCQSSDAANDCVQKDMVNDDAALTRKANSKTSPLSSEDVLSEDLKRNQNSSSTETLQAAEPCAESDKNVNELPLVSSAARFPAVKLYGIVHSGNDDESNEKAAIDRIDPDVVSDSKTKAVVSLSPGNKILDTVSSAEVASVAAELGSLSRLKDGRQINEDLKDGMQVDERPADTAVSKDMKPEEMVMKNVDDVKAEKTDGTDVGSRDAHVELRSLSQDVSVATSGVGFANHKSGGTEENKEIKADCEQNLSAFKGTSDLPAQVKDISAKSRTCKLTGVGADEIKEFASSEVSSLAEGAEKDAKVGFDLNEGLNTDEVKYGEPENLSAHASGAVVPLVNRLPFPSSSMSTSLSATITVAAAAKGPFVPPDDLLRTKVELGWKGSAATSAFRPAEPRKLLEMPLLATNPPTNPDTASTRPSRPPLDIDLNVADGENVDDAVSRNSFLESTSLPSFKSNHEMGRDETSSSAPTRASGGLGLDLNQIDEATDLWSYSTSCNRRPDVNFSLAKSPAGSLPNGTDTGSRRDFDLNDGPAVDDLSAEPSITNQHTRSGVLSQQPVSGLKMNNMEVGNFTSWFPPGSTYSAVTIPSMLSNRGEQSLPVGATGGQPRMLGPSTGGIPFNTEIYRAPVLSSSPAMAFPSTPFQYPVFPPYAASFPLQSATFSGSSTTYVDPSSGGRLCFPPVHSQLLGPPGAVSTHYSRPFIVSLPDGGSSYENNRKWARQPLDLNSGPGGPDMEGRDETSSLAPRQLSVVSSQVLAEDQARMYQVSSGVLKRKEPDGGWDNYKQSSWQ